MGELYGGRDIRPILLAVARLLESDRLQRNSIFVRQIGVANKEDLPDPKLLRVAQAAGWFEVLRAHAATRARSMTLDSDGLLLIQPQTAVQVPAKLFEYLRMGRPILAYVVRDLAFDAHSSTGRHSI